MFRVPAVSANIVESQHVSLHYVSTTHKIVLDGCSTQKRKKKIIAKKLHKYLSSQVTVGYVHATKASDCGAVILEGHPSEIGVCEMITYRKGLLNQIM